MIKKIKLYGERNTGTNYLYKLFQNNFHCKLFRGTVPVVPQVPILRKINSSERIKDLFFSLSQDVNLGWKHSFLNFQFIKKALINDENLCIVLIIKNPYSFLLSLNKNPYHDYNKRDFSFETFLMDSFQITNRDKLPVKTVNPIELWNFKMNSYKNIYDSFKERVFIVKYEELLLDPEKVLYDISTFFSIEMREEFVNFSSSTKNSSKNFAFYSDYYLNERWRSKLDRNSLNIINRYLDRELCYYFDYNII